MWTASMQKTVHSPQGPAAYHPLDMPFQACLFQMPRHMRFNEGIQIAPWYQHHQKSQWDPLNMDNVKGMWSPLWTPLISRVPIHCRSVSEWMCKLIFKFMLKIAYLTLWTLTFWKDFGPVLSYCHTVAFSANRKGLKAAPVNRPTREEKKKKKTACMADSITGTHLCSCPRTILLPFGLHHSPKYPQHPLVASTRKSTKQNIGCKRKKGMQSSNKLPLQTHQFILVVSLKTHGERERDCTNQVSPP